MKRSCRSGEKEEDDGHGTSMARVLMLLSTDGTNDGGGAEESAKSVAVVEEEREERVFECKTWDRSFPTFQALGGHRASHKKPKLASDGHVRSSGAAKPRVHECSICGIEFAVGQALGGHMRRHRAVVHAFRLEFAAPGDRRPQIRYWNYTHR